MTGTAQIVKVLRANSGSRDLRTVFTDFCEMSAIAIRNRVDPAGFQDREDTYENTRAHYSAPEMGRFAEALALVAVELASHPRDVLGEVYMQLEIASRDRGQFFTPYSVAQLMAGMLLTSLVTRLESRPFVTVSEPACGAGALVIATTQALTQHGFDYRARLHVTADDLSLAAVHMCYVQLSLLDVLALVNRRNTLTMELFDTWATPAHVLHGWAWRLAMHELHPRELATPTPH